MSDAAVAGQAVKPEGALQAHRWTAGVWATALLAGLLIAGVQLHSARGDATAPGIDMPWMSFTAWAGKTLKLPWQSRLETLDAAWRYEFFGQLGNQVEQGCPGWLFFSDGLRAPVSDLQTVLAARIQIMQSLAGQLAARGVQLLVVTVPDKSRVQQQALCGLARPAATVAQLPRFIKAMDAAGVRHVELTAALQALPGPAYYRTDVHMNQTGALRAAQVLADAARPLLGGDGTQAYTVHTQDKPATRMGDLIVLAGLEHAPAGWRPALDSEIPQTVEMLGSGGLLDAGPVAHVLLAGSSNSRRSNFAEQLGRLLHQPIVNESEDGGKFADALVHSMGRPALWTVNLRLVIWEMSEMSLLQPLSASETALVSVGKDGHV